MGVVARAIAGQAAATTDVVDGRSLPPSPQPLPWLPAPPDLQPHSIQHYCIKYTSVLKVNKIYPNY